MPETKAARRYAKALISLAQEQDAGEIIGEQLAQLAQLFTDPELAKILSLPALPLQARQGIVEQVVSQTSSHDTFVKFLRVLADNNRLRDLVHIDGAYQRLLDQVLGRIRAQVRSAAALSEEEAQIITAAFSRLTKKTVEASFTVETELLGGIIIEIEGRVYDATLKTQLARLESRLAQQL